MVMGGSVRKGRVEWMVRGDEEGDGLVDMMVWIARGWGGGGKETIGLERGVGLTNDRDGDDAVPVLVMTQCYSTSAGCIRVRRPGALTHVASRCWDAGYKRWHR